MYVTPAYFQDFIAHHGKLITWTSIALSALAIVLILRSLPIQPAAKALGDWTESLGAWGPVAFGAVYIVATVLLLPGSILTLLAGAIFGLWIGLITVSIAATTGAACAFLIARHLARKRIERMVQRNGKFDAIDRAIEEGGWKVVALLRLSPVVPFNLQNYLYGLTAIRFWPYVLTSWIAMLPGTFMYVYIGSVTAAAIGGDRERTTGEWVLLGAGLLATIVVTVYITRLAKRKLATRTEVADDSHAANAEGGAPSSRRPIIALAIALFLVAASIISQVYADSIERAFNDVFGFESEPSQQ